MWCLRLHNLSLGWRFSTCHQVRFTQSHPHIGLFLSPSHCVTKVISNQDSCCHLVRPSVSAASCFLVSLRELTAVRVLVMTTVTDRPQHHTRAPAHFLSLNFLQSYSNTPRSTGLSPGLMWRTAAGVDVRGRRMKYTARILHVALHEPVCTLPNPALDGYLYFHKQNTSSISTADVHVHIAQTLRGASLSICITCRD